MKMDKPRRVPVGSRTGSFTTSAAASAAATTITTSSSPSSASPTRVFSPCSGSGDKAAKTLHSSSDMTALPPAPLGLSVSTSSSAVLALPPRAAMSRAPSQAPLQPEDGARPASPSSAASSCSSSSSSSLRRAVVVMDRDRDRDRSDSPAAAAGGVGPCPSCSGLFRERNDHIAALRLELDRLTRGRDGGDGADRSDAAEMASFWETRHSALHVRFLHVDADLRVLRAEFDAADRAAAAARIEMNGLRRDLRAREDEAHLLQDQVRGLKEWVSTSTRTDGQTSDEVFGEAIARLANSLQNWVIVNFRRARLLVGPEGAGAARELGRLVPGYGGLAAEPGAKIHLLQSVVSAILVEMVFGPYFVGLSDDQTSQFRAMEALLSTLTSSPEAINQWRATTLTLLLRHETSQAAAESVVDAAVERVNRALDSATSAPGAAPPTPSTPSTSHPAPRDTQALRVIVATAVELGRQLASQRAVFQMLAPGLGSGAAGKAEGQAPRNRILFDPVTMENVGAEDDETLVECDVYCVVFPGVVKRGDERGGRLHFENVIAKARVLCRPDA